MSQSPAVPVSVLPKNPAVLRRLLERSADIAPRSGEDSELSVARAETALMALFRDESSEQAFQALYELASPALAQWIVRLGAGHVRLVDVENLMQDTFVNIYRYAESFRDEHARSFRVWSRAIAGNVLRRSRSRGRQVALEYLPGELPDAADPRADPSDHAIDAEEQRSVAAAWMILLSQYLQAWQQLAPRDRLALDLVEIQGLSYSEAGERLGVGLSNMKMIMFRARRRIRATIAGTLLAREEKLRRLAS